MAKKASNGKTAAATQNGWIKNHIGRIIGWLLVFLVSGSAVLKFTLDKGWEGYFSPKIVVEIMRPFPDPKDHNYDVQIVVIENVGRRHADAVKVAIPYPSTSGMENISFSYPQVIEVKNIRRVNNQIAFEITCLPMKHRVVVALNASVNTGTSDRYNVKAQVDVFTSLVPAAKNFAVVRSPNESNSKILGDETIAELKNKGLNATEYIVNNAADISIVVKQALAENDCIVVNGDNVLTENLSMIINLCTGAKKPLFVGDPDSVKKGAVATVGPSYAAIRIWDRTVR